MADEGLVVVPRQSGLRGVAVQLSSTPSFQLRFPRDLPSGGEETDYSLDFPEDSETERPSTGTHVSMEDPRLGKQVSMPPPPPRTLNPRSKSWPVTKKVAHYAAAHLSGSETKDGTPPLPRTPLGADLLSGGGFKASCEVFPEKTSVDSFTFRG